MEVCHDHPHLAPAPSAPDTSGTRPKSFDGLSKRHMAIIRLLSAGQTNGEIGEALFVQESTVKVHITLINRALGTRNRADIAYRFAKWESAQEEGR